MSMRSHKSLKILSVGLILFLTASSVAACDESEQPTSEAERRAAQTAARRFVRRMQQTRDVSPLIRELFLPNFISHFVSDGPEAMSPEFYARLSQSDRRRWFVAQNNFSYLTTLDVLNGRDLNPSDPGYEASIFKSILPDKTAEKLRALISRWDSFKFTKHDEFRSLLTSLELALTEARAHLLRKRIEQTPEFQNKLDDKVTGTDIGYRVRAYVGGENVKDCPPLIGFAPKQKFYRVEIPLMMGVILVKHGKQMKIVTLTYVDGD